MDTLLRQSGLSGDVTFAMADLATGTLLEHHAQDLALPPASVAKALSASYALDMLGPDFRFETKILATGEITDGVLDGDLVLAGGADPTLNTDDLARVAQDLAALGLRKVTGQLLIWNGGLNLFQIDPAQPAHVGYNPSVSGLNLNFNRVHFEWRRQNGSYSVAMDARTERYRPQVRVARMRVEPRSLPIYTYQNAGSYDDWTVAKNALGDGGSRWLPVRKPELYAAEVFRDLARAHGITLGKATLAAEQPAGQTLVTHESAPLADVLRDMLKYSTNLTAEIVGLTASKVILGHYPDSLQLSADLMNAWAEGATGIKGLALVDHSGLGDSSRVSSAQMMYALQALHSRLDLRVLLKPFHMRDEKRRIIKDHPIKVQAKTGTLNFVSGLAGFVDLPDGREIVFAIFVADLDRRAGLSRAERENPEGGRAWNIRAKKLQQALIERWAVLFAA
jgi:D-alanyl-D-alanine carboxypeptidase/D-alanyl-D-alanine-endopeptidase (penicillin-binding protein 4)